MHMSTTTKMPSKGPVVIPEKNRKKIRDRLFMIFGELML